ncbi:helix-turn-helix domain-containing protein [Paenibacillus sp. NPDC056579]|uniref:winged helix-turn-helix domain-containing protein n=1 Tax=Paenibacillus sp. NPDC056579 TaxID=3345871 RepID=UPI0036BE5076
MIPSFDTFEVSIHNNVIFNIQGGYVQKGDVRSYLTLTEFRTLYYFINHANRRILPEELIEHLSLSSNALLDIRNLYNTICKLRKKIEPIPQSPQILLNVRPGYIFLIE